MCVPIPVNEPEDDEYLTDNDPEGDYFADGEEYYGYDDYDTDWGDGWDYDYEDLDIADIDE